MMTQRATSGTPLRRERRAMARMKRDAEGWIAELVGDDAALDAFLAAEHEGVTLEAGPEWQAQLIREAIGPRRVTRAELMKAVAAHGGETAAEQLRDTAALRENAELRARYEASRHSQADEPV